MVGGGGVGGLVLLAPWRSLLLATGQHLAPGVDEPGSVL